MTLHPQQHLEEKTGTWGKQSGPFPKSLPPIMHMASFHQIKLISQSKSHKNSKLKTTSHLVVSDSLQLHGLQPTRLLCPCNSPGSNTGVGYHFLLQGIFPTQGLHSVSCTAGRLFIIWAMREAIMGSVNMSLSKFSRTGKPSVLQFMGLQSQTQLSD